jgi:hypothetical protein
MTKELIDDVLKNDTGRMALARVWQYCKLDSTQSSAIQSAVKDYLANISGFAELAARKTTASGKGISDANALREHMKKAETWLSQHPTYKAYFGAGRVFSEESQAEAVRSVVLHEKEKIVAAHKAAEELRRTQRPQRVPRSILPNDHPLLQSTLPSLWLVNFRILDSRTGETILRIPMSCVLRDPSIPRGASLDGNDIDGRQIERIVRDSCDERAVQLWKERGNKLVLASNSADVTNRNELALAVNDFNNGPRGHQDMCIELDLGEQLTLPMRKLTLSTPFGTLLRVRTGRADADEDEDVEMRDSSGKCTCHPSLNISKTRRRRRPRHTRAYISVQWYEYATHTECKDEY